MNTVNFYRAMAAVKVFKHSLFSLQLWFPSNITVLRAQMGIMYSKPVESVHRPVSWLPGCISCKLMLEVRQ